EWKLDEFVKPTDDATAMNGQN
ncbi:hypothetical protein A2U01_0088610, partial [Trifolium medium]|nr:hypothetical protein [Trifolium medium]